MPIHVRGKPYNPGPTGIELHNLSSKNIAAVIAGTGENSKPKISNTFTWEISQHGYSEIKGPFQTFLMGVGFLQNVLEFQNCISVITISHSNSLKDSSSPILCPSRLGHRRDRKPLVQSSLCQMQRFLLLQAVL